jgi:hypothetical protein
MLVKTVRRAKRFGRNHELAWRYVLNLQPTLDYRFNRPQLRGEAAAIVRKLDRDGIAISTVPALLGPAALYDQLKLSVGTLYDRHAEELNRARQSLADGAAATRKPYFLPLLGVKPAVDPDSIYAQFALQREIAGIATSYFGMSVALRYYNVWHNFITKEEASESQLWHRDPEDRYILKVFVHLSDVDAGAGPFTYAAGSHNKGSLQRAPEFRHKDGETPRSDDRQMAGVVARDRWVTATGTQGTIVFADTRGYHKGGLARERERSLYACEFTSPSAGDGGILCRPSAS